MPEGEDFKLFPCGLPRSILIRMGHNSTYTVERQWLEHLWNHNNMFETGLVQANGS